MEINISSLKYITKDERKGILPWGIYSTPPGEVFLFSGKTLSSRAGAWYWKLPKEAVRGYGLYEPFCEFIFDGEIEVTSRRNDIPKDGWGWRVDTRKWVYLRGEIFSVPEQRFEQALAERNYPLYYEVSQGHLLLRKTDDLPEMIKEEASHFVGRRKIFNHQFFGDCGIFYTGCCNEGSPRLLSWVIVVSGETIVVSPDHLFEPVALAAGTYVACHPEPTPAEGVD